LCKNIRSLDYEEMFRGEREREREGGKEGIESDCSGWM
jgi:hypothetical protein